MRILYAPLRNVPLTCSKTALEERAAGLLVIRYSRLILPNPLPARSVLHGKRTGRNTHSGSGSQGNHQIVLRAHLEC
jgi:hypothetical protein